ncbi:MAG: hypothetical protein K0S33_2213 [Bacteroidetes bacterium]|jgi:hypothetical protein|nr:hypothetical protein [Bacteroidota bacterium]
MQEDLSIFDLLLTPVYLFVIWIIAFHIRQKNIRERPEYKYFVTGLFVKILGAFALGFVYYFYYGGGDTTNYFQTARAYVNLAFTNQEDFMEGWLGNPHILNAGEFFSEETGRPVYYHRDHHSFFVVRLLIPIVFLGSKSYFASAALTAVITYTGVWKLYQTFLQEFPALKRELAIAIIFVPSCVFWGSGLMKDSFTLSAVGWFTYSFYYLFIRKHRKISYILQILISSFIIISIKPYIFFALLPGAILWLSNDIIKKIHNKVIRFVAAPFLLTLGVAGGFFALSQLGDKLGLYKVDTVLERATIVQKDMKAEYYGGKTFDIGDFDASATGVASKAHVAIFAGLFRPGIWDVRNAVMLVSSLENTYLLLLTIFLMIKLKVFGFLNLIRLNPLLLFSILFSIFFAFSVGLTVANFGSLVRLRIPELPFFVAGIFILRYLYEQKSGKKVRF